MMTRTTGTGGGNMLRRYPCEVQRRTAGSPKAIAAAALSFLLLSGCLGNDAPPPVTAIPTAAAACEALRPDMPIRYSSKSDTPETVKQVRAVNARFASACP